MEPANIIRLILMAVFVVLLFQGSVLEALLEANNNFPGGPPTPRHPMPADDIVIVRRKRSQWKKGFSRYA
jgi:hypothetical protein